MKKRVEKRRRGNRINSVLIIILVVVALILIVFLIFNLLKIKPQLEPTETTITRSMPSSYTPGNPLSVSINFVPLSSVKSYAVEETPPAGWAVQNINNEGSFVNGKIRWIFHDNIAREFSYTATPPSGETGMKTFSGEGSTDGSLMGISGATTINRAFDFSLSNRGSVAVVKNNYGVGTGATTITANLDAGAPKSVYFSASGLPTQASATFTPNPCNPLCSTTMRITARSTTPIGTSRITVYGRGGGLTRTTQFDLIVQSQLNVIKSGPGKGKITGTGIDCGDGSTNDCKEVYSSPISVTLTAIPDGSTFAGWNGGGCYGTSLTCTTTMSASKTLAPTFK